MEKRVFRVYFVPILIPKKYAIRVLFVCPWTSLIPPLAIRVPPGTKQGRPDQSQRKLTVALKSELFSLEKSKTSLFKENFHYVKSDIFTLE